MVKTSQTNGKQQAINKQNEIEFLFVHRYQKTFPNFAKMRILC